jgi:hypothetical protein
MAFWQSFFLNWRRKVYFCVWICPYKYGRKYLNEDDGEGFPEEEDEDEEGVF